MSRIIIIIIIIIIISLSLSLLNVVFNRIVLLIPSACRQCVPVQPRRFFVVGISLFTIYFLGEYQRYTLNLFIVIFVPQVLSTC
jgi:hypothetical protein